MKRALPIALVGLTFLIAPAIAQEKLMWGGPITKELKGKSGSHSYRVFLRAQNAKAGNRKITLSKPSDPAIAADWILINGKQTYGFDGISHEWAPKGRSPRQVLEKYATEIAQFDVWIDGKRIPISRRKHETMLVPDLGTASAELTKDGKRLTVIVSGSDGAGFWTAMWQISKSGKVELAIGGGG